MKKTKIFTSIITLALLVSCGSTKQPKAVYETPSGSETVELPCSGTNYFTDDKYFRASQSGTSAILDQAMDNAMAAVKTRLATDISADIQTVANRYNNSTTSGTKMMNTQKIEAMSKLVSEQSINGTRTICEKVTRITEEGPLKGYYRVFIAQEVSIQNIVEAANQALSRDEELKVNYDYEKFKKEFELEMAKRKSSN